MTTFFKYAALSVAAALGFVACGQSAGAQDTDTPSVKVRYADLNLASEAGAKAILQRIHSAARAVCEEEWSDPTELATLARSCVAQATDRAVAQLDSALVTAVHHGRPLSNEILLASKP